MNSKHQFAIFFENLSSVNHELIIADKDLYHRLINILRLQAGENLILFNQKLHCEVQITSISKKEIKLKILEKNSNKILSPKITMLVSILKREAFEEAIYYCVEMGANVIQPVITEKVHSKKWEWDRLKRIIISAAEQSKNYNFPELLEPQKLEQILAGLAQTSHKIFFDANGQNLSEILDKVTMLQELILLTGPEGDLTPQEKEMLKNANFQFYRLTPTILRAQTAVALGLGFFRIIYK